MNNQRTFLLALLLHIVAFSALAESPSSLPGSSEYKTSNPDGRLTIRIQVWGDIGRPGTYYVADNTRLSDLLGLTGGSKGDIEDVKIRISRITEKDDIKKFNFNGLELISSREAVMFKLARNDIIYVESKRSSEDFLQSINMISAVTGVVSSVGLLYLFYKQQQ